MHENEIGAAIISAAMRVHSQLGPGLLESAYEACLRHELGKRALRAQTQLLLPVRYDDLVLDVGYRIDLLVEDKVVIELKTVQGLLPAHKAQLLSYLKLWGFQARLSAEFPGRTYARRHCPDGRRPLSHRALRAPRRPLR